MEAGSSPTYFGDLLGDKINICTCLLPGPYITVRVKVNRSDDVRVELNLPGASSDKIRILPLLNPHNAHNLFPFCTHWSPLKDSEVITL